MAKEQVKEDSVDTECPVTFTPDLSERLAVHLQVPELTSLFEAATSGNKGASRQLHEIVVTSLSLTEHCDGWPGPESPDAIIQAVISLRESVAPERRPIQQRRTENKPTAIEKIVSQVVPGHTTERFEPDQSTSDTCIPRNCSKWRDYARQAGFPLSQLSTAAKEILDMTSRVLIKGEGWGPNDSERLTRTEIPISPRLMSRKGQMFSKRTYQRALSVLCNLGLLAIQGIDFSGRRIVTPAWWPDVNTDDPVEVWRKAAAVLQNMKQDASPSCRPDDTHLAPSCHSSVTLPRSERNNTHHEHGKQHRHHLGVTSSQTSDVLTFKRGNGGDGCPGLSRAAHPLRFSLAGGERFAGTRENPEGGSVH